MAQDGLRLAVRLPQHFLDERSAALVWVPRSLRIVQQLEERLRRLFRLRGAFCLLRGSYLLPASESLQLLRSDDELTVVPLAEPFDFNDPDDESDKDAKKKKRKKHKEKENVPPVSTPEIVKKKHRSFDDPVVTSAIENIEKLHAQLVKPDDGDNEEEEEEEEEVEVENMKSKALTLLKELAQPGAVGVSDGRITKRKRIRIRKSKKNNSSMVSALSDSESNPPQRNNTLVLLNGKINSHIRFPTSDNAPVTILRNKVCKIDDKPRVIKPIHSNEPELLNGVKSDNYTNGEPVLENGHNLNFVLNHLDQFPETNNFPDIDHVIMFKMLKLDEQYNPTLSNHIIGKVVSRCAESQLVKFSIIEGHQECAVPTGKFDVEECDNLVNNANNELDIIWNQVIEPRAINL